LQFCVPLVRICLTNNPLRVVLSANSNMNQSQTRTYEESISFIEKLDLEAHSINYPSNEDTNHPAEKYSSCDLKRSKIDYRKGFEEMFVLQKLRNTYFDFTLWLEVVQMILINLAAGLRTRTKIFDQEVAQSFCKKNWTHEVFVSSFRKWWRSQVCPQNIDVRFDTKARDETLVRIFTFFDASTIPKSRTDLNPSFINGAKCWCTRFTPSRYTSGKLGISSCASSDSLRIKYQGRNYDS